MNLREGLVSVCLGIIISKATKDSKVFCFSFGRGIKDQIMSLNLEMKKKWALDQLTDLTLLIS